MVVIGGLQTLSIGGFRSDIVFKLLIRNYVKVFDPKLR